MTAFYNAIFVVIFLPLSHIAFAQLDTIKTEFKGEVAIGILKDEQPFSGFFIDKNDVLYLSIQIQNSYVYSTSRLASQLLFPNTFFKKTVDVQIRHAKIEYHNGVPNGVLVVYDWDGDVIFKTTTKDGKINGAYTSFYKYQKKGLMPFATVNYVEGKKEGAVIFYKESGEILGRGIYKNDLPFDGQFYNGLHEFQTYRNGKLSGKSVTRIPPLDEYFWPSFEEKAAEKTDMIFDIEAGRYCYLAKGEYRNGKPWNGEFYRPSKRILDQRVAGVLKKQTRISAFGNSAFSTEVSKEGPRIFQSFFANKNKLDWVTDSILYTGIYKNGEPYQGDFFDIDDNLGIIFHQTYEQGVLLNQVDQNFRLAWEFKAFEKGVLQTENSVIDLVSKAELRKRFQVFSNYDYFETPDLDIDSLVHACGDALADFLKKDTLCQQDSIPSLEIVRSKDQQLSVYTLSYNSGGTAGAIFHPLIQWKKSDGSFGTYKLYAPETTSIGEQSFNTNSIINLGGTYSQLYFLEGGMRGSSRTEVGIALVVQLKNDFLILDYPAFYQAYSGLMHIDYVEDDADFCIACLDYDPIKKMLSVELFGEDALDLFPLQKKTVEVEGNQKIEWKFDGRFFVEQE